MDIPTAAIVGVLLAWLPFLDTFQQLASTGRDSQAFASGSGLFIAATMLLWIAGVFSLIRYGWHSPLTSYSLLAALLSVVATCTHSLPCAKPALAVAIIAFLWPALVSAQIRRSLMTLTPAILAASATAYLIAHLPFDLNYTTPLLRMLSISVAQLLSLAGIECSVLALMHRRLSLNSEATASPAPIAE